MSRIVRLRLGLLVALLAALVGLPAQTLGAEAVTMEASPTSIAVGASSTVTARAPVTRDPGVASQEIIQRFDPAQLTLVGATGIRYPQGWTLSYSTDGTNFTQTAPANALAWLQVRAVKATGAVDSEGATAEGYQISEGESSIPVPVAGSFTPAVRSGDGFDVIFDGENRLYNIFHHNNNGITWGIDCRTRTGAVCWTTTGSQTTYFETMPYNSTTSQSGWVDRVHEHLWYPTSLNSSPGALTGTTGFICVDLSPLGPAGSPGARPTWCGGSQSAAYRQLGTGGSPGVGTYGEKYDWITALAEVDGRLYTWETATGKLLCVDTLANGGAGAPCPGQPYTFPGIDDARTFLTTGQGGTGRLYVSEGRIYGVAWGWPNTQYAICFDPATGRACTGWSGGRSAPLDPEVWNQIYEQPNVDGGFDGICFAQVSYVDAPSGGWPTSCWTRSGLPLTPNPDLLRALSWGYPNNGVLGTNPIRVDSRLYATNALGGNWATDYPPNLGIFYCWDVATDAMCAGFPKSGPYSYSLVVDSENGNCFWANADSGTIASFDANGNAGCALPPPSADLDAQTTVPRMACESADALRAWRSLRLTSPATNQFTRSSLTVLKDGRVVVSNGLRWENIPIPRSGQRLVDLSDLLVADSGTQPTFRIRLSGRSGTQPVTAVIQAIGDAPELCLPLVAQPICPAAPMVVPAGDLPLPPSSAVAGNGSAAINNGSTVNFLEGIQTIQTGRPAANDCLGSISGTAAENGSSRPVAGVVVELKDASGNVLATTTTDASGNYSFGRLTAGSGYRVAFGDPAVADPTQATTGSATTSRSVAVGTSTDVDATYLFPPDAPDRAASAQAGAGAITFDPFAAAGSSAAATPTTGSTFVKADTRLCDASATPADCTKTSLTVDGQGTWTVDANGRITFTPLPSFVGAATPIDYVVEDATGATATGTLSPTVTPPVVVDDKLGTTINTAKTSSVATNDQVPTGTNFVPATQPAHGTVTMNLDGTYTYTPNAGYTGPDSFTYKAWSPPYCPAGGTISSTPIVSGLRYVVGSGLQERGPSANLVANGDFTTFPTVDRAGNPVPAGTTYYRWGALTTAAGTASLGFADAVKAAVPGWTSTGGGTGTYANVTTNANWGNAGDGASAAQLYFGNYWDWSASPWPMAFDANSLSRATYTFATSSTVNGGNATTPTLAQSIPTEIGRTYRLQFMQLAEVSSWSGIAALEIGGYGRTYFEVKSPMRRMTFEFVATSTSTRIAFMSWGHVKQTLGAAQGSHEFSLDDVIGNACDQTAQTATVDIAVGPAPTAAPDTSTGAFNADQTIDPLTNDTPVASTRPLDPTTVLLCAVNEVAPACTATSRTFTNQGTYSVNPTTGQITFDPVDGFVGQPTPITYAVADPYGQKASSTYQPTVEPAPPVAPDRSGTAPLNTAVTFDPYATVGSSPAATPSTGSTFTNLRDDLRLCGPNEVPNACNQTQVQTTQGTWTVANTGVVTFQPATGFTGTATPIAYTVVDARGLEDAGVLSPTIVPPPTATPNTSSGAWGAEQDIDPLANDVAGSGATLVPSTVRICPTTVTNPAQCTGTTLSIPGQGTYVVDTATGHVYFNPEPDFIGQATAINYVVQDSLGQAAMSTIRPTVTPPPPSTAANDTSAGGVGQTQSINPLANDLAPAGVVLDPATVRLCGPNDTSPDCRQTTLVVPGQGTYTVDTTTGRITFVPCSTTNANCPNGAFTGTATPVTYSVTDTLGRDVAATYTPTVVPPPTVAADTSTGAWDANQTINPLANDTASPPALLDITSVGLCAATVTNPAQCTATTLNVANVGTYTVDPATGLVTFDPLPGFTGQAPAIQYAVSDEYGQRVMTTIQPTVAPPAPPQADPEAKGVRPGASVQFTTVTGSGGLGSTSGPALVPASTCLIDPATQQCDGDDSVTVAGEGTYTLDRNTGVVTYTALNAATPGAKTPITYQITDASNQTAQSTLTPFLPTPPTAVPDQSYGEKGAVQTLAPLGNDTPGSTRYPLRPSTLKLCAASVTDPAQCTATSLTVSDQGVFAVQANGTVTFTPCTAAGASACPANTEFVGDVTQIRYTATDDVGQTILTTIDVKVLPAPVPSPVADAQTGPYATPLVIDPLANDGAGTRPADYLSGTVSLDPATVRLCVGTEAVPNCTGTRVETADGVYTVNTTTGAITFTPAPGFTGTATSAPSYMVCNRMSGEWTVADGNDADSDPDVVAAPSSQCATAPVVPTIQPPIQPSAADDVSTGAWDVTQTIAPLANDTKDPALTWDTSTLRLCAGTQTPPNCGATSVTVAGQGTYTVNPDGTVSFDPVPGFTGPATPVRYQVEDSFGRSVDATITPTVTPPTAPTAEPETKRVLPGQTIAFTNITGANGLATGTGLQTTQPGATCLIDPSDATICSQRVTTADGTWEIDPLTGIAEYTAKPTTGQGRKVAVAYRVTDVTGQTATAKLTPIVPPPPTAVDDTSHGLFGQPQTLTPLANDDSHLVASTLRLCDTGQTAPDCDATGVVVPEGVYEIVGGAVRFTPEPGFATGAPTPIAYQATDELGQTATAYLRPYVDPAPPTVDAATVALGPGQTGILTPVIAAGSAPIDPALTCLVPFGAATCAPGDTTLVTAEGTYVLDPATGTVAFTPAPGFVGTVASPPNLCVTATDGRTACGTLTPTVSPPPVLRGRPPQLPTAPPVPPVNDTPNPMASPDVATTQVDTPITFALLLNDAASEGQRLRPETVQIQNPETGAWGTRVVVPGEGTYLVDPASGSIVFTPAPGYTGTAQRLDYRVRDTAGKWAQSTLQVRIVPTPPPYANPDYAMGPRGQTLVLNALTNDLVVGDAAFDPASVRLIDPATGKRALRVVIPRQGTYVVDQATGQVRFTPLRSFVGTATPVPYTVTTTGGKTVRSTLNPTIYGPLPRLRITTTPSVRLLRPGQTTVVTLRACNVGSSTAVGSSVRLPIPVGTELRSARGATVRAARVATWATGTIAPGQCVTRKLTLTARVVGAVRMRGTVTAINAAAANDPAAVRIVNESAYPSIVTG